MSNSLVSIIVPVYGVERFITRCAKSLFEQSYENIEYIFVDDHSLDNSTRILKELIELYPYRKKQIRIIRHVCNRGLAATRNTGLDNAHGDFIVHIDSDDYVNKDYISLFVNKQEETDADIVVGQVFSVYKNKEKATPLSQYKTKREYLDDILSRKTYTNIWGKFIKRSLYEENNIRNVEGINNSEDYQVFPQLLFYAKSFAYEPKAQYMYCHDNEISYSNSHKEENDRQIFKTIDILRQFFYENDSKYVPCLDKAEFTVLIWNLKHWCYVQGHDDFFKSIKSRLLKYDMLRLKSLDWKAKLALYGNRKIIQCLFKVFNK